MEGPAGESKRQLSCHVVNSWIAIISSMNESHIGTRGKGLTGITGTGQEVSPFDRYRAGTSGSLSIYLQRISAVGNGRGL
jgi:hypothetical protein